MRLLLMACVAWASFAGMADAGTLERVRADGVLRCGGVIRPGLDFPAVDGRWFGIEVDVCRAVAAAVLGSPDKIEFTPYTQPNGYDAIRNGSQSLFFLTASEILAEDLLATALPVVPVFYETHQLMVPAGSPAWQARDLTAKFVCVEPGTGPERSFVAFSQNQRLGIREFPFQEIDEMIDAFAAGRCDAVAQEVTALAALRLQAPPERAPRILPDVMSVVPVFAATNMSDAKWSAIVTWTVHTLMRAEPAQSGDPKDHGVSLPVAGKNLGLDPGWQARALAAVGGYDAMFDRNLGTGSPLNLPRGVNAAWSERGLLAAAYSE